MKLSGWLRLWILLSGILFVLVTAGTYVLLPTASEVPDSVELHAALSPDALAQMAVGEGTDNLGVQMRNGHTIYLKKGIEPKRSTLILAEYNSEIDHQLWRKRMRIIGGAFAVWLSICAVLYGLGWSVGWVYRGFRGGNSAP